MIETKPLISICIPTYNRSRYLEKTIQSIIVQEEFVKGIVEVVISDNASTDDTEARVKTYIKKYPNIKYFKNEQNVRDQNFPLVLSYASGILRKLNNDTLVLTNNSLKGLCDLVRRYKDERPNIFFSNGFLKDISESRMNFREFILNASFYITWIGSFAIWDDQCIGIENDKAGCDLLLWQVRKFYEMSALKNDIVIYNNIFGSTLEVPNKNISYGLYKVFYQNYMTLLLPYTDFVLDSKDLSYLKKDLLYNFFTNWIIAWELSLTKHHYSSEENLKESVFNEYRNESYWNEYYVVYKKQYYKSKIELIIKNIKEKIIKNVK